MNFPADRIHHLRWSYGRIIIPPVFGVGIARFDNYGLKVLDKEFHNCRATGVY